MFKINSNTEKTKVKMLVLSGISLFVALTETLPDKVAVLGFNFSGKESILGWFMLSTLLYFFARFMLFSTVEIIQYYLPDFIENKMSKTSGDTLGLTHEECLRDQDHEDYEIGTISGELYEINNKNKVMNHKYKHGFVKFSNATALLFEILLPLVFAIIGMILLYRFLA